MQLQKGGFRLAYMTATLCWVMWALSACSTVGPAAISMGRASYNEAIRQTNNQQMLMAVVQRRYGERANLLAVSSVTANVRFSANAGVQAGYGSSNSYQGNLIPFSGGFTYEENPTISYAPLQGDKYLRQFLEPIPLDMLVLYLNSFYQSDFPLIMLVKQINGISNPAFLPSSSSQPDSRFLRLVELFANLHKADVIYLVKDRTPEVGFDMVISGYAPTYSAKVREFLDLLGLPTPANQSEDIIIPIYFALQDKNAKGIALTTRSVFECIELLSASVQVPAEQSSRGLAVAYPPKGPAGKEIHIRVSKDKPENPSVAIKYRGYWFYIDASDQNTKLAFRLFTELWEISIAGSAKGQEAPVLTVPVSQ